MNEFINADLERRLVTALHEQIPRLRPLAAEADEFSPSPPARRPGAPQAGRRTSDAPVRLRSRRSRATASPARAVGIAAAVGAIAGLGALFVLAPRSGSPSSDVADTPAPVTSAAAAPAGDGGSPLTTGLPADVAPRVVADGWTYAAYSGIQPLSTEPPSTRCPGCGADRLLLAADGALFAGPIVTAWAIDDVQDPADFDWPVTIGGVEARFMGAIDGDVPAAENHVTLMLPLPEGRTGYVESYGLANDDVFALAASIDFTGAVPTVAPPAGFHVVDHPRRSDGQWSYASLDGPDRADGTGVWHTLEVYATNLGLQGLTDWRYPTSRMLIDGGWTPRSVDGVVTAFDDATADPESAGGASAIWVAGDWAYVVVGHRFTSAEDFDAVLRSLRLTDGATFDAATAGASQAFLATAEEEAAKVAG